MERLCCERDRHDYLMSLLRHLVHAVLGRPQKQQLSPGNSAWQDEVIARLDSLAQNQTVLATESCIQFEKLRPSWQAVVGAVVLLVITGALLVAGTSLENSSSVLEGKAAVLRKDAQQDNSDSTRVLAPLVTAVSRNGARYVASHMTKPDVADIQEAEKDLDLAKSANATATKAQAAASNGQHVAQLTLPTVSAFLGAILGWLLTQWFAELRWKRARQLPEDHDALQSRAHDDQRPD